MSIKTPLFARIRLADTVAIAILAVLSFAIDTTVGLVFQPVLVATLGPLTGGLVSAIPMAIVIFLGIFMIPRVGGPTLYAVLFLALTTFTASFGPPGFHKVFIGVALGLTVEIIVILFRRSVLGYFIAVAAACGLSVDFTYLAWKIFSVRGAAQSMVSIRSMLPVLTAVYAVLGLIGSGIMYWIYKTRLSHYAVVRKLRFGD
jgi:hypothetical protein